MCCIYIATTSSRPANGTRRSASSRSTERLLGRPPPQLCRRVANLGPDGDGTDAKNRPQSLLINADAAAANVSVGGAAPLFDETVVLFGADRRPADTMNRRRLVYRSQ